MKPPFSLLTHRQREVLALLCEGLDNLQLAARLGVHEGTAKKHVHEVLQKLGVETRHAAAVLALRSGFGGALP